MNAEKADEIADAVVKELYNVTHYFVDGAERWSANGIHAAVWNALMKRGQE